MENKLNLKVEKSSTATTQETLAPSQAVYSFRVFSTVNHKHYTWEVTKTYEDFQNLHNNLRKSDSKLPLLPSTYEFGKAEVELKHQALLQYLIALTSIQALNSSAFLWEFLEISAVSFRGTSKKHKEGYVYKRTGGRVGNELRWCQCSKYFRRLQKRWMIVRDDMVGYTSSNTKQNLHEVLMFKGRFEVLFGLQDTGFEDGIRIITSRRYFVFRAGSVFRMQEWVQAILDAYRESEWSNAELRYESSFPIRRNNDVKLYVDGEEYFKDVYEALTHSKREVFISDWWLSPEMHLKRPFEQHPESQVFEVLGKLADRGVRVCVHLYKEVSFALTINSLHTKKALKKRNPNIKVMRHPQRSVVGGEFLWSHHEKIVCIDQEVAFLGGLDLCWGRWDTSVHPLTDLESPQCFLGIDYSNARIADFRNVKHWNKPLLDRATIPRMPWHDISVRVVGKVASDVALHFIELWNHVMTDITGVYWKDKELLQPIKVQTPVKNPFKEELEKPFGDRKYLGRSKSNPKLEMQDPIINSPDKVFPTLSVLTKFKHIDVEKLERKMLKNTSSLANAVLLEEVPQEQSEAIISKPCFDWESKQLKREAEEQLEEVKEQQENTLSLLHPKLQELGKTGTCECQLVRSAGLWSLGLESTEHSIHSAYLRLIDRADHFIYIENQFFISSTAGKAVKNQVVQALVQRIKVAAQECQPFHVMVVLPLLPGFEGAVDEASAAILRVQLHWEYQTISRGVNSLLKQLEECPLIQDPFDYVSFYGLRTYGELKDPVTEIIYVHSKMMIIDDDMCIVGSANINDRSMLGYRDSEIGVVINDSNKVESILGGKKKMVSKCVHELRVNLFKEHLGTNNLEFLKDPLSKSCLDLVKTTAELNTQLYRHIFRCYPDNQIQKISEIKSLNEEANKQAYQTNFASIKGHIVELPLQFLAKQDLRISVFNREYLIPEESFV